MSISRASFFAILFGAHVLLALGTCPIELHYFEDSNCANKSSYPSSAKENVIPITDSCTFVLGALYKVSCKSNIILFQPCVPSSFVQSQEYILNSCLTSPSQHDVKEGPFRSFMGQCDDDTLSSSSCPASFTDTPTISYAPSLSPTPRTIIADFIELPSPPLPPNDFADKPLDIELAHEVVHLAGRLIYQMYEDNAASILPDRYTFHLWEDTGSTEVLIVSTEHTGSEGSDGKIMVVFRGTDETPDGDWLTNINLPKVPFGPNNAVLDGIVVAEDFLGFNKTYELRVHRGFNNVFSDGLYQTVLEVILPLLQRESANGSLYYDRTIHFVGHSLGGANAQVFGSYFAHFHPQINTYVTTLGAPRQGNYAYKIFIESMPNLSVWRMVNCRDVVPRVPNFQYYHAGHLIWKKCKPSSRRPSQEEQTEAYYRQSGDFYQQFAEVPRDFIVNSYEPTMISDHLGGAYLEWLEYGLYSGGRGKNWTSIFEPIVNASVTS